MHIALTNVRLDSVPTVGGLGIYLPKRVEVQGWDRDRGREGQCSVWMVWRMHGPRTENLWPGGSVICHVPHPILGFDCLHR